ncbi:uncharacterized protein LOC129756408 isoform X2 [Uranotaenia lowii]|uniref:uncharacterized protein LOC129756408 isoform X2 n=1 Tax=Uranotaenia lowii TaxID=190385 RepID=UPI00247A05F3|nr:uncharacterized protein LOC129756408 isoform X2 [Uranotaenia lowii]
MTSQAVYCLSLQIRPPADESSNAVTTSSSSANELAKVVTTSTPVTAPGGAIITGLDTSKTVTISEAASRQLQSQIHLQQAQSATVTGQPQQHSNIILVRGSRSENGQIILQNTHELLSLLSDEDKPILLQHQRLKAKPVPEVQTTTGATNTILFQPAIKSTDGTILLQPDGLKKTTLATTQEGGPIFLQQRFNKNGSTDGPILLRTLKRIDKSQSILVIRNASTATATATAASSSNVTSSAASIMAGTTAVTVAGGATIVKAKPLHQVAQVAQQQTVVTVSSAPAGSSVVEEVETAKKEASSKVTVTKVVQKSINFPLGTDGEPIKLPENLESLPRADHFPTQRHRWNTNEEIAAILISFDKHSEWQSKEVKTRPKSGSMLLYSRKKVRYRRDGYCWKKRKDGKTTREDHMKLKVQGTECIYGCYVHSAILPTFHRRCYWLLQNPDIVLVHYLNVPYPDDNKMAVITPNLALWGEKKEWTKEELVSQLKPMFFSEDEPDAQNELEISTAETVEAIVSQLMEKQRMARQSALVKQLECGCSDANCVDGKSCSHPMRRISAAKSNSAPVPASELGKRPGEGHFGSTAPNVLIGSRMYPRWIDNRRAREQQQQLEASRAVSKDSTPIHFQVIPTSNSGNNNPNSIRAIASNHHPHPHHQQQQQQHALHQQQQQQNSSSLLVNGTLTQHLNSLNASGANNNSQLTTGSNGHQLTNGLVHHQQQQQQQHQQRSHLLITGNNSSATANSNQLTNGQSTSSSTNGSGDDGINQQQQRPSSGSTGPDGGASNGVRNHNHITVGNGGNAPMVSSNGATNGTPSLVLNLSQLQGNPGSLLILNGQQPSFVCHSSQQQHLQQQQQHQQQRKAALLESSNSSSSSSNSSSNNSTAPNSNSSSSSIKMESSPSDGSQHGLIPKQEVMDATPSTIGTIRNKSFESMFGSQGQQQQQQQQQQHAHDNLPFFNETLDLSQEDIQKTLSANMPLGHAHVGGVGSSGQAAETTDDAMNGEINPMDFIENCGDNHDPVDDDVFVNLDAFDMLVEFPELELDAKSGFLNGSESDTEAGGDLDDDASDLSQFKLSTVNGLERSHHHSNVSHITDFSPEWAYPEGGVKVLVTGPWNSSSSYTVLFDSFPVPTTLVQNGVLRCYCPAHEVGVVTLQVACDGYVISNTVNFEYKSPPKLETKCEGNGNDMLYKFNLLNRLESIDEKMQIKVEPCESPEDSVLFKQSNFEERLVTYCQTLMVKMWRSVTPGSWLGKHRGMTLLHLASALGYAKLVRTMLTWKTENSNVILEAEIDALSQDQDGFTPLMWACSRGHVEAAVVLYKWNQNALNVKNKSQQCPLEVAKLNGFIELVNELEKHEIERLKNKKSFAPTSSTMPTLASITLSCTTSSASSLSASSATSISPSSISSTLSNLSSSSNSSITNTARRNSTSSNQHKRSTESANDPNKQVSRNDDDRNDAHPSNVSPEHNIINDLFSFNDALNASNGDSCSNDQFGLSSSFNPSLSPYSDVMKSSGNNSQVLHYALENNNSNPMLSNALSPSSDSNRSHDGVFLRPGAVFSSGQSPPGARLSKRSSIDSGINMDSRSPLSKTGKSLRDMQRLNRNDRSMSLPLASTGSGSLGSSQFTGATVGTVTLTSATLIGKGPTSIGTNSNDSDNFSLSLTERTSSDSPSQMSSHLSNTSLLSPLRKMDFALCEVSAATGSPMCEDTDSLHHHHQQEDERHSSNPGGVMASSIVIGGQGLGLHSHLHQLHVQQQQQQQHLMLHGAAGYSQQSGQSTLGPHSQMSVSKDSGGEPATQGGGDSDVKVLTLAEQIIAAMPDRIKNESEEIMSLGSPLPDSLSEDTSGMGSILNDSFMEPLLDSLPSSQFEEFNFEFSDHSYRYHDVGTPCSSLSPASSGPLQSPASYSIPQDHPVGSPSPPPTTQDFTEFLQATNTNPFEKDFSNLKLNDREQRELYEAAKCIQKAYRSYKGRKNRMEEQDKERSAAVVIQNYYRRYKQYAYYRQMTQAAVIIQNGYRSYCENKRFKKSQSGSNQQLGSSGENAEESSSQCIQSYYKTYKNEQKQQTSPQQQQQMQHHGNQSSSKEPSPSGPLKRTYSQRTQNQAARKIQQFMRQSKNNTWDEQMTNLTPERTSRKREAGPPTAGGVPSKLTVSRGSSSSATTASVGNSSATNSNANNNNNNSNSNSSTGSIITRSGGSSHYHQRSKVN